MERIVTDGKKFKVQYWFFGWRDFTEAPYIADASYNRLSIGFDTLGEARTYMNRKATLFPKRKWAEVERKSKSNALQ